MIHALCKATLVLAFALFAVLGLLALATPQQLATEQGLASSSGKGIAEIRGFHGGVFLSWCALLLAAWLKQELRSGMLLAFAISLGCVALTRLVSLTLDGQPGLNLPALIVETLAALAALTLAGRKI